jgi:predicted Rossmann-fold nucleotide-binding protein
MGTFEEVCEIFTWGQLGLHMKPCGLLNVKGFYAPFLSLLDTAVAAGFLKASHRDMVLVDGDPSALLEKFAGYTAPATAKWLTRETT